MWPIPGTGFWNWKRSKSGGMGTEASLELTHLAAMPFLEQENNHEVGDLSQAQAFTC